ncbi:MAG: hypothetical protein ABI649_08160 [Gaiellaceae bacterium]
MRPFVTWLVVGALVVIGLFAARDALRQDEAAPAVQAARLDKRPHTPPSSDPPRIAGRRGLVRELRDLGANGFLYVVDPGCRRFILRLPHLRWTASALPAGDCGTGQAPALDLRFGLSAVQEAAETIEVGLEAWRFSFRGTAPAFKPGGTLTFVRDGTLYEWSVRCPAGAATVTFRGLRTLSRCRRPVEGAPRNIQEVVWLTDRDYAAIAGPERGASLLVVRRRSETSLFHAIGIRVGALQASPGGRYLAARVDGTLAYFRTDRPGARAVAENGALALSLAWSPDDRYAAVATESGIRITTADTLRQGVDLLVSAAALSWR